MTERDQSILSELLAISARLQADVAMIREHCVALRQHAEATQLELHGRPGNGAGLKTRLSLAEGRLESLEAGAAAATEKAEEAEKARRTQFWTFVSGCVASWAGPWIPRLFGGP